MQRSKYQSFHSQVLTIFLGSLTPSSLWGSPCNLPHSFMNSVPEFGLSNSPIRGSSWLAGSKDRVTASLATTGAASLRVLIASTLHRNFSFGYLFSFLDLYFTCISEPKQTHTPGSHIMLLIWGIFRKSTADTDSQSFPDSARD